MPDLAELDAAMLRPGRAVPAVNRLGGGTIAMAGADQPWRVVGRTAAVYQLRQPSGRVLALRCPFARPDELDATLGDRYRALGADPALAPFRVAGGPLVSNVTYVAEGLSFPGAELRSVAHPLMAMEWVMGPTLLAATDRVCRAGDQAYLEGLAEAWVAALIALGGAGFSHGDLSADNVVVRPGGGIALVDYDTCAWPGAPRGATVIGKQQVVLGAGYGHPSGLPAPLQHRDDFPALVIYATLRVLAVWPELRQTFGDPPGRPGGVLLFGAADLRHPENSDVFDALGGIADPAVRFVVDQLRVACGRRVAETLPLPEVVAQARAIAARPVAPRPAPRPPAAEVASPPRAAADRPAKRERTPERPPAGRSLPPLAAVESIDPLARQRQLTRLNSLLLAGDDEGAQRFWRESGLAGDPEAARELGPRMMEIERRQLLRQARAAAEAGDAATLLRLWDAERFADYRPAEPLRPLVEAARRRLAEYDQLEAALARRDAAAVLELWPELRGNSAASRLAVQVHDLLSERSEAALAAAIARGDDQAIVAAAQAAEQAGVAIGVETRRAARAAANRIETRRTLVAAAAADDRATLSALALSGELGELGTIEPALMRAVLRALAWPHLDRALARDDDAAIVAADSDLFAADGVLNAEQRARVELARARTMWLLDVRAALRRRDVVALRSALVKPPPGSEARLSRVERARIERLTARDDAVERLTVALRDGPDTAIVDALSRVEAAGAPLPAALDWAAIRGVVDRVTLADAIREAASSDPPDYARLARLLPAARAAIAEAPGSHQDDFDFARLERDMLRAAHLARLRDALANDDDAAIAAAADPDPYGTLGRLTEAQRLRVARAMTSRRGTAPLRAGA